MMPLKEVEDLAPLTHSLSMHTETETERIMRRGAGK